MYKCPNCAGEIEFLPASGKIKCQFCGSEFSLEEGKIEKTRKNAEEHKLTEEGVVYTCSQCGANLYTMEDTGVTFCSYCGSQAFLKSRVNGMENIEPDLIIPFSITKEQCIEIYKERIRKAWFLPKSMKADKAIEKFRGIYMPCWIYEVEAETNMELIGTEYTSTSTKTLVKEYKYEINARGKWDGYVYDATSSFPDRIMGEITPFDLKKAVPFDAKYMAGFYGDIGNVPSDAYSSQVLSSSEFDMKYQISKSNDIRGSNIGVEQISSKAKIEPKIKKAKKGFMPVWFLSNKNNLTGRMSYAIVNGQNGKIHADLPVDMKKYFLLALLIAIPAFILLQFITLKPEILMVIIMIVLGITMSISVKMLAEVFVHEHSLDDVGASYVDDDAYRAKYLKERKEGKQVVYKRRKKAPGTFAMAIICFFGFPLFMSAVSVILDISNLATVGFALGLVFFIVSKCTFAKKGRSDIAKIGIAENIKLPFGVTVKALAWQLIGILAGILILLLAPVRDIYYYAGVIICAVTLILSILGFVRKNNALSLRKPAQLNKRGGDEDEV